MLVVAVDVVWVLCSAMLKFPAALGTTLLCLSSGRRCDRRHGFGECPEQFTGDVSNEASTDPAGCLALPNPPLDVVAGPGAGELATAVTASARRL